MAKLSPRIDGGIKLNSFCEGEATLDRSNSIKNSAVTDPFAGTALYPPINPSFEGFLKVSDVHTIAYSIYGNPNGKPVLFVHGGPGGGTDPCMYNQFIMMEYTSGNIQLKSYVLLNSYGQIFRSIGI